MMRSWLPRGGLPVTARLSPALVLASLRRVHRLMPSRNGYQQRGANVPRANPVWDVMDKFQAFKVVKLARTLIQDVNTQLSQSSQKQYQNAFARMQRSGLVPEEIANTQRSFYYYRAAWVHNYASDILEILNSADLAQRSGSTTDWQDMVLKLPSLIQELERYRPDPKGKHLASELDGNWAVEAEKRIAAGKKIVNHSKRVRLRGLPQNWREQMFAGLREGSKYQDIVAVLSATGARPEEFVNGIKISIGKGETLHFDIGGAKTHDGKYGQEERSFDVSIDRTELIAPAR